MIDIGIIAANETRLLYNLLYNLIFECDIDRSNIYIVFDSNQVQQNTLDMVASFSITNIFQRKLEKDMDAQHNYLASVCKGPYVLHLDADETIKRPLIEKLNRVIQEGDVDILGIPRVNKMICNCAIPITELFKLSDIDATDGKIAWPDYQTRFQRLAPHIQWIHSPHQVLVGAPTHYLPADELLAIQHIKLLSDQWKSREFWRTFPEHIALEERAAHG